MNISRFYYLFFVLFFLCATPVLASQGPTEALKPTLQGMINVLADPGYAGKEKKELRREKIMTIVEKGFDFGEMSKLVLGRTWKKIDPQQRDH
ncbi:MAG TPA: hypothetical protein EYP18_02350, partial [Desulfobacterales bacterium]|nr:hypothetical protein [Desulfobacterales bacterium]